MDFADCAGLTKQISLPISGAGGEHDLSHAQLSSEPTLGGTDSPCGLHAFPDGSVLVFDGAHLPGPDGARMAAEIFGGADAPGDSRES